MSLKYINNIDEYLYQMGYILNRIYTNNTNKCIAIDEDGQQIRFESADIESALSGIKLRVTLAELNKPSLSPAKLLTVGLGNTTDGKAYIENALGEKGHFIMARVDGITREHLLKISESLDPESPNPNVARKGCQAISFVKDYYQTHDSKNHVKEIDGFLEGKTGFKNLSTEILDMYVIAVEQYMEVLRKEKAQYLVKDTKPKLTLVK